MDDDAPRWWRAAGPWWARLEPPPGARGATPWRPAWGALLAGGEPTMPLTDGPTHDAPIARRRGPRHVRAATVEGALAWARTALEADAAGRSPPDGDGAPPGVTVAFRRGADSLVRWRARDVADVRAAARAVAGWHGPPPPPSAPQAPPPAPRPRPGTAARPPLDAPSDAPPLSPAQRAVVDFDGGRAVVLAVAGAGKTTTMVARVRRRVAAGRCDPATTLVVSFSRAAVAAVRAKLGADPATAAVDVRTFHALAHRLLAVRADLGGPRTPVGPPADAVVALVAAAATREAAAHDPDLADAWRAVDLGAFTAYRGRALARLELPGLAARPLPAAARAEARPPPPDPERPAHPALLEDFERVRAARGWLDHDQLLVEAWAAVHADAALVAWARGRWRAWLVDEAQDLNAVQLALLERLTEGRDDVVLVGDDDQAIYGFRGAAPGLLRAFAARHGARVLVLDDAYRTRAEPLAAASALLERGAAGARFAVRARAARGPGGALTLDAADGPDGEAAAVLARAVVHRDRGARWRDQAVLLRRFDQAPALERAAARRGVPLRLVGTPPLARHPDVVAAWAGVALALGALDDAPPALRERAWRRWLAGPGGLAPSPARTAARALAGTTGPGAEAWRRAAPRGADPSVAARLAQVAAAPDAAAALAAAGVDPRAWPQGPGPRLAAALDLRSERPTDPAAGLAEWRRAARARAPDDALLVTSVHRAKGLEWPVVHVPGLAAGTFPTGDDPEERRLAYVAWTRARDALHLYRDRRRPPSPFLAEGDVAAVAALADDLAWLRGGVGEGSLAAAWARREAAARFGAPPASPACGARRAPKPPGRAAGPR